MLGENYRVCFKYVSRCCVVLEVMLFVSCLCACFDVFGVFVGFVELLSLLLLYFCVMFHFVISVSFFYCLT